MNNKATSAFLKKAEETIRLYGMTDDIDGITVAFSGGADSTVLLDVLYCLKISGKLAEIAISAFHVNHGIRGEEADRDEEFCREFCKKRNITFDSVKLDVPSYSKENGLGLEEAARKLRYTALFGYCTEIGSDTVATAHHADDNLETVLFRLTRGTGAKGLCGIPPLREENGIKIIRPLIRHSKAEIEEYVKIQKLDFVTDSTNSDTDYARNRIRKLVVPELKKINPNVTEAFTRLCEQMNENRDIVKNKIEKKLTDEYRAFAKETVFRNSDTPMLEYVHITALTDLYENGKSGAEITLPGGIRAIKCGGGIEWKTGGGITAKIHSASQAENNRISKFPIFSGFNFFPNGENGYSLIVFDKSDGDLRNIYLEGKDKNEVTDSVFEKLKLYVEKIKRDGINIYKLSIYSSLNSAKLNGDMFVRFRENSDTVFNGGMHKKVKKLISEKHISEQRRSSLPFVCDNDDILWIPEVTCRDGISKSDGDIKLYYIYSV